MPARDYVRLVLSGVEAETDIGVVQSLLAKASLALSSYGDPANRSAALRTLTQRAYELMQSAEPGSDVQLVYAQVFAAAEDPDQLDHVRALYDGTETVTGLTLDTELRWHFLIQLAAHGRADTADIDAQLSRDRTAAGEKRAASARAALPTAEAKAAAWSAVVDSDELSNHMQLATMRTFWLPEQAELCRPHAEEFFAKVGEMWKTRTNEIAQTFTEVMYPSVLIEQDIVDRTDRYLAEENPQPALRRALIEGRDTIARALRARARDIEAGRS
jgi:aminopeptidase N